MKTTPYRRRPRLRARGDNRTSTDRAQAEYVVRSRRRWSRLKADCWTGNGPPARRKLKPWEQGRSHKRAAVAGDSRSAFEALQVYPFIGSRWNRARPTAPRGDVVSLALSPGRQPASAGLHPGAQLALGQLHLAGHFSVAIGHFHCGRSGWGHVVLQAGIFGWLRLPVSPALLALSLRANADPGFKFRPWHQAGRTERCRPQAPRSTGSPALPAPPVDSTGLFPPLARRPIEIYDRY